MGVTSVPSESQSPAVGGLSPEVAGLPPAAVAQFRVLQQRFLAGLPARWQEIDLANSQLALKSALHRLAGSAGSYGFESLGQLARHAESLTSTDTSPEFTQALAALAREISQLQPVSTSKS